MSRGRTEALLATELVGGRTARSPQQLLVEEPLEIRVGDDLVATTMRTPGHDFELAVGFLWAEGTIGAIPAEVRYCGTGSALETGFNVVSVQPAAQDAGGALPAPRLGLTSSSCGICGVEQVEALVERLDVLVRSPALTWDLLARAGTDVPGRQELFGLTGGSHAAASVDAEAQVTVLREDVGRHNAVDKVVGSMVLADALARPGAVGSTRVLWVSGRASFEIVQKAWAAGFSALVAVGAVSALAVSTAERAGLVLAGFARDGRLTVYAGADRLGEQR